jgi:DNA-binding MarR family transcriptional regulator
MGTTGYKNVDKAKPDECLAAKIMKSHRIMNGIFRKHLQPFGITNPQLTILFTLSKRETVTQTELGNILFLEKSSVSRNMRHLTSAGLISRANHTHLKIEDKGLQLLEEVIPAWNKAMDETKDLLGMDGMFALDTLIDKLT